MASPGARSCCCAGTRGPTRPGGDPLAIWRDWADDIRGRSLDCGHHLAEEAPGELAAELREFLAAPGP
ncbi:MAG: alpha/beta fold hydrolase [Streptosporangiales bacterium]